MNAVEVERIVRFYIEKAASPDMRQYGQSFLEHYDRHFHSVRHMMELGRMRSARVLDLGCGYGWHALMIALLGDNEVVANDIRDLMGSNISERLNAVRAEFGIDPRISTLIGDFMELDVGEESFDSIFCNETIEHVHDLGACFRRAHTILKPRGFLIVANDNNCLMRRHLVRIEEMWEKRDASWEFIEELKQERPQENKDIKPYAAMREEIIRDTVSDLGDDAVRTLVYATAGQDRDEIVRSVQRHRVDGSLPERPDYSWCRNPITGEYCERQFDPFELKEMLRQTGFRVRLLQDLRRGGPLKLLTKVDIPLANAILFRRRAPFVFAAQKP